MADPVDQRPSSREVSEGADATFTVTLSHAVDASVTVAWSAPGAGDDAVAGDLGSTSGTVTFPANSAAGATRTITIGAVDDMLSEGDETFTVSPGHGHVGPVGPGVGGHRGRQRRGDHRRERPDHHRNHRAGHRGRGRLGDYTVSLSALRA